MIALKIDAKFEGKLTRAFKNKMRNLANFHKRTFESLKIGTLKNPFIQSRKCVSLKLTDDFCVMTVKNDTKFEEELTCIGMKNFDPSTRKSKKIAL